MSEIFEHSGEEFLLLQAWRSFMPELIVGFTTKKGGFSEDAFATFNLGLHVHDSASSVHCNRKKLANLLQFPLEHWVCCEQTHDSRIEKVTKNDRGKGTVHYGSAIAGTDGLYTDEAGILLALCFADCVPLYFMAPKHGMIGIAHAGWKGTVKNIAGEMVRLWNEYEHIPLSDIYVAIGPSIGPCCYIVDDRVIDLARNALGEKENIPCCNVSLGQYALDLKELNKLFLVKAGIREQQIAMSHYCTSCAADLFFSHRRDNGQTGRMMAFIGKKEDVNVSQ